MSVFCRQLDKQTDTFIRKAKLAFIFFFNLSFGFTAGYIGQISQNVKIICCSYIKEYTVYV